MRRIILLVAAANLVAIHGLFISPESVEQRFDGHSVYRVKSATEKDYKSLVKLFETDTMDFWTMPRRGGFTDIRVNPEQNFHLLDYFANNSLNYSLHIKDIEGIVESERRNNIKLKTGGIDWKAYYRAEEIYRWMDSLAESHPDLVSVVSIGKSSEGRDMKLTKISKGGVPKPTIFIDSTFHAREWISSAVSTYIINQLTTNSSNYKFLDKLDFHILPLVNPDGFEWSHTSDRMWRKTRSDHGSHYGCRGADPNRNFGYQWGGSGTSSNKCSEIYKGPAPFSEPETAALRDYILNSGTDFRAYITIHSYSQLWLTPWGFTTDVPTDYNELESLAKRGAQLISQTYGTQYQVGSSTNVLYAAAGGSDDWAKGGAGIKYSYTIELRDTGHFGFILPANQIEPTAHETWQGLKYVASYIAADLK